MVSKSTHTGSGKIMEIERLRAVAVMLVVFTHFSEIHPTLPSFLRSGFTGVDLFFVISGFVVSSSLFTLFSEVQLDYPELNRIERLKLVLKVFYLKRIFRIFPAALFWLGIYLGLATVFQDTAPGLFGTFSALSTEAIYFLTGFYNYLIQNSGHAVHYVGHYWSLTVEEHFYFLLPWILFLVPSRRGRIASVLFGIVVVAAVLRPMIDVPPGWNTFSFNMFSSHRRFDTLFIGVLIALLMTESNKYRLRKIVEYLRSYLPTYLCNSIQIAICCFCVLMIWALPAWLPPSITLYSGFLFYAFFSGILVALAVLDSEIVFSGKGLGRILEYLGSRSYAIYLSHIAAITLWIHYSNALRPSWLFETDIGRIIQLCIVWVIILLFSDLSYRFLESPLIQYGKRFSKLKPVEEKIKFVQLVPQ